MPQGVLMTVLGPNDPRAIRRNSSIVSGSRFSILKSGITMASGAYNEVADALPDTKDFQREMQAILVRHISGDWGDVDKHDWKVNEDAVKSGARILSAYTVAGVKLWIISDAAWSSIIDVREVTTILRPEDY
jgi:hypothetical protein